MTLKLILTLILLLPFSLKALEAEWMGDNTRLSLDFSSRYSADTDGNNRFTQFAGLDLHKVFTSAEGDIGTFVGQFYLFHDDADDRTGRWDTQPRIITFNYTGGGYLYPNIRIGHLELPYGLESSEDTNGSFLQYGLPENFGIKTDWGVSVNKVHEHFDYELALSSGSGKHLGHHKSRYIVSGRIGTPFHENLHAGLSFFNGKYRRGNSDTRSRFYAADLRWQMLYADLLIQLEHGEFNGDHHSRGLLELQWRNSSESLLLYTRISSSIKRSRSGSSLTGGFESEIYRNLSVSGFFRQELETAARPQRFGLQLRYRF